MSGSGVAPRTPRCASPAPCRWARGLLAWPGLAWPGLRLAVHGSQKEGCSSGSWSQELAASAPGLPALSLFKSRPPYYAHSLCTARAGQGPGRFASACHSRLCPDFHLAALYSELQRELAKGWHVPATVFYDRPPDFFRPATLEVRGWLCVGWRLCLTVWLVLAHDAHAVCGVHWGP